MPRDSGVLAEVAGAILDGTSIDWASAESSADAVERSLLDTLRVVATLADVHRRVPAVTEGAAGRPGLADRLDQLQWGHLRVLERIGRGTFGDVHRAWDSRLDREVALKLLPATPLSEPHSSSSLIREGRLLAKVRHPNVVTIYGAEQIGDQIGLWMEFVRGQTLEQLLQEGTAFRADDAIRIGLELARAVSAVHAAGLLHRDIKAHNVTRAADGRVVLMDFGTGRELNDNSSSDLAGTPLYLAPEVLAGGPATVQSDVYSLGVLLYYLLTRSYPIRRQTIQEMRLAHARNERVSIRTARPDVPPALARVIDRAIAVRPECRYTDADSLARDLTTAQRPGGTAARRYWVAGVTAIALGLLALDVRSRLASDHEGLLSRSASLLAPAQKPIQSPVIAVMPFKNLSSEGSRNRLVDSLTAGLIQQLGVIDGLKVIFQQSSFMFRDRSRDPAAIGRQLGVNLVVNGDARLAGDTLVIRAALVPTAGGDPLWSDTLTRQVRSAGDLTDVLSEIARTIVNKLRLTLGPTQRRYTTDIVTYETYLRARELREKRLDRAREAIPLFEEVIRRDPSYAPAHAALAATYGDLTMSWPNAGDFALAPSEAAARMAPLTAKALEIDPMLAEAHVAKAYAYALARRWLDAEASFRHAILLDPTITAVYGDFVLSTLEPWGRLSESIATLKTALDADPLSLDLRNVLARIQLSAGFFDEALANCRYVVAEDPGFPFAEEYCARALAVTGRTDEALSLFNKRPLLNEHGVGYVYAVTGRRAEAEKIAARNAHFPNRQALIYAALGDKDRAFEALERLAALNPRRAGAYLNYPELSVLRNDPRADVLRRKLGFPPS